MNFQYYYMGGEGYGGGAVNVVLLLKTFSRSFELKKKSYYFYYFLFVFVNICAHRADDQSSVQIVFSSRGIIDQLITDWRDRIS